MKYAILISVFLMIISFMSCKNNQVKTEVHVWGNCDIAKFKIDSAAKLKGVSYASWNKESRLLSLTFDSTEVSLDNILKSVAMAGFDNERYMADDYAYQQLPDSCQYERKDE